MGTVRFEPGDGFTGGNAFRILLVLLRRRHPHITLPPQSRPRPATRDLRRQHTGGVPLPALGNAPVRQPLRPPRALFPGATRPRRPACPRRALDELDLGDRIDVHRAGGSTATFTVDRIAIYPKDRFPTVEVYRNLDHAGLRLVTCGGDCSASDSHCDDNVVVHVALTDSHT